MITLRQARADDVAAICAIFNYYVINSTSTFYTEPLSESNRLDWLRSHSERHPIIVAEEAGEVVGWAALSEFRARQAYSETVEISVFIRQDMRRRGIGRILVTDIIRRAREAGFHTIIAGTCAEQTASLGLQAELGFRQVARLSEVGRKFGRWLDIVCCQLMLDDAPRPPVTAPAASALTPK